MYRAAGGERGAEGERGMINLMYAGNTGVFGGLIIGAVSAAQNVREPVTVYILTMDLTEKDPAYIPINEKQRLFLEEIYRRANPQSRVILIDAGDEYRSVMLDSPNGQTSYTPYTFLRLFADRLPSVPDRVLYLDTDTLINRDIGELFRTDMGGAELAAVRDYYGRVFMGRDYFNAGVLLLDMKKIRENGLFARAAELCAGKKLFLPDQTALNRLVSKKLLLPGKYNEQKHFRDDTVIQHFAKTIIWFPYFHTRNIKPWQTELVSSRLTDKYDGILAEYRRLAADYKKREA